MKSAALQFFTDREWVCSALLLFLAFFAALVYKVFWSRSCCDIENGKMLVFDEGDKNEPKA